MSFRSGPVAYRFDPNTLLRTGFNVGHEWETIEWVGNFDNVESKAGGRMLMWIEGDVDKIRPLLEALEEPIKKIAKEVESS